MRRIAAIFASVTLLACGSEPAGLDDGGSVVQSVEVVENDSLTVTVDQTSDTVTAVLRDADGNPVAGDLSSWEVEGGSDTECGFWEATSLESNSSGEVKNVLNAGEVAWTAGGSTPDCRYRVVHSSEGAPEPVRDTVQVRTDPGEPRSLVVSRVIEDGTANTDGSDDGDAVAQLTAVWHDAFGNPSLYDVAVTSGPAEVVVVDGAPEWAKSVRATGATGTGTVEVWSTPDSSFTLSGTLEVTGYDGGSETWVCVELEDGSGSAGCEGPPN